MYSFLISIFVGAVVGAGLGCPKILGMGWSITLGVISFLISQYIIGRNVSKKIKAVMDSVQMILASGQKKIQNKMARWQIRPPGSIQAAQAEIARDQKVFVLQALEETTKLNRFKGWSPMLERQIATAQFQLYWMIKDLKNANEVVKKVLFFDPVSKAIKISLLYKNGASLEELKKAYEQAVKRVRYNQNVLAVAAYSWILVNKGEIDAAHKVLVKALEKTDNEFIKRNCEHLANNRITQFSNAGLGEQWYSLFLEEPKVRQQRMHQKWR